MAYIPHSTTMASMIGSTLATLGGKRHTCLEPFLRLQSSHRGCFLIPFRKIPKMTFHNPGRSKAPCASSAPSGTETGDEGRPAEAYPFRGAIAFLAATAAAVVDLVKLGWNYLEATGNLSFRPPWSHQSSLSFSFIVYITQSNTPPGYCSSGRYLLWC